MFNKLLETAEDVLVYAGNERHLGIDYKMHISGYAERENRLGVVLMRIRQVTFKSVILMFSVQNCLFVSCIELTDHQVN